MMMMMEETIGYEDMKYDDDDDNDFVLANDTTW
jgi:hypothetical protein